MSKDFVMHCGITLLPPFQMTKCRVVVGFFAKANGGSNLEPPFRRRVNRAAVRRLFFFAIARQVEVI